MLYILDTADLEAIRHCNEFYPLAGVTTNPSIIAKEKTDFWRLVGLLHDVDFEQYPDEHCQKAPELLAEINAGEDLTHAVCSHGYGLVSDVEPTHEMEKVLFAVDELTGLINAGALVRPSKSVMDMGADSVKRKFKDKHFAAGCSRDVIRQGAENLGWELKELFEKTILAMRDCEASVREELPQLVAPAASI